MDHELYMHLAARARGKCECGCGADVTASREVDHFFGRAKADEVEGTCWVLAPACHYAKTRNSPDSSVWIRKFIEHCKRWGYVDSQQRAESRLVFVDTRRELGSRL